MRLAVPVAVEVEFLVGLVPDELERADVVLWGASGAQEIQGTGFYALHYVVLVGKTGGLRGSF